jgi:hypothetical protein
MSVSLSEWADELTTMAAGLTEQGARQALRATLREFCVQTGAWNREMEPIDLFAGQDEYDLNVLLDDDTAEITIIQAVEYRHNVENDTPRYSRFLIPSQSPHWKRRTQTPSDAPWGFAGDHERTGILVLVPPVGKDLVEALVPYVSLRPSATGDQDDEVPDVFRTMWFDVILEGAAGRLHAQPDKPYTNVMTAQYYMRRFRTGMSTARDQARRQFTSADTDFTFPGWANKRGENRRTVI